MGCAGHESGMDRSEKGVSDTSYAGELTSIYARDVMLGIYIRVMARPWENEIHKGAYEVIVCKSCRKEGEVPIKQIRSIEGKNGTMPLDKGMAEKIAKTIANNPYKFLKINLTEKEK